MPKVDNTIVVASFTDPRMTPLDAPRERYIRDQHRKLVKELGKHFKVLDPQTKMRQGWKGTSNYGISSDADVAAFLALTAALSAKARPKALVVQSPQWTEPSGVLTLAKELDLPVAVFSPDDPDWAGNVSISAIGASMLEQDNWFFRAHLRTRKVETLVKFLRAAVAYSVMQESTVLFWGDSDCLRMKHLQGDVNQAESIFVRRVAQEGQYRLIARAEAMIEAGDKRVGKLVDSFEKQCKVCYKAGTKLDERLVLEKQTALYLAARDRLDEMRDENVIAVSIKCQPELSEDWGITGCLIPSFLPFALRPGDEPVPTTCEGDFNGTLSVALLQALNPGVPPLFGDFKYVRGGTMYISNCGGSSVYYAANSMDPKKVLPQLRFEGQCQGKMGAAVGYWGKATTLTVLRLFRIGGEYRVQLGLGKGLTIKENPTSWGAMWPTIGIALGVDDEKLVRVAACNHFGATEGDFVEEAEYLFRFYGIPVERMDSNEALDAAFAARTEM